MPWVPGAGKTMFLRRRKKRTAKKVQDSKKGATLGTPKKGEKTGGKGGGSRFGSITTTSEETGGDGSRLVTRV